MASTRPYRSLHFYNKSTALQLYSSCSAMIQLVKFYMMYLYSYSSAAVQELSYCSISDPTGALLVPLFCSPTAPIKLKSFKKALQI